MRRTAFNALKGQNPTALGWQAVKFQRALGVLGSGVVMTLMPWSRARAGPLVRVLLQ